jgi:peptidyl-prolyl cis-trans isomerase SurA
MTPIGYRSMMRGALAVVCLMGCGMAWGQGTDAPRGVELDRVVAVVNGDLILDSDVDEERRLSAFQPFRVIRETGRDQSLERLVDRTLILQQSRLQPETPITDAQIEAQFAVLRKDIPACKEQHCETDAGWQKFVTDQGFTMEELKSLWGQRMEVLRFIEERFRTGIRISDEDIQGYYEKTLLPEYARQKALAPKLETIAPRIQEILLQQQVSGLLTDWLKSLRAQGSVRMMQPGQVAP